MPHFSLRTKLILSFSIVIIIGVFLSATMGIRLIGNTIINQAQDKVRLDLNSAREVYNEESENIKNVIRLSSTKSSIYDAILKNDREKLIFQLQKIRENESLDVLSLTDNKGRVIVRSRNPEIYNDQLNDEIINLVLLKKITVVSTQIINKEELEKEGKDLAERAKIPLIPTPKAREEKIKELTSGMMIKSASPIIGGDGELVGVLYGGKLLNKNYAMVDKIKDIVYRGEKYKGKDIGTSTIFQGGWRISTNVLNNDGTRAIGTRASEEVYEQVIVKGIPWISRAFVVNAWYRTAYEPIRNINGEIIGMLYVGMLESPYIDLRNRVLFIFLGIAFLSVILLSIIAYFTTNGIVKPINELLLATNKVAQGDLSYRVQINSHDEIGQLANSFNMMTSELEKATENYLKLTKTLEEKVKEKTRELEQAQDHLIKSEKLSSLGKLAAGIAHEINNPLTSILINSHLISETLPDNEELKESINLIIDETTRCSTIVKGLLEFSRQSPPQKKLTNINSVIEKTLLLLESQILLHNVNCNEILDKNLPKIMIDTNKITQVFTNIILNALDAMPNGGNLLITSQTSEDNKFIEIKFTDTGCGISQENIGRIFDPFFTSKGTKGTGLGLSISYGIIQQHDGTIEVQSEVGKGTTITIFLPIGEIKK